MKKIAPLWKEFSPNLRSLMYTIGFAIGEDNSEIKILCDQFHEAYPAEQEKIAFRAYRNVFSYLFCPILTASLRRWFRENQISHLCGYNHNRDIFDSLQYSPEVFFEKILELTPEEVCKMWLRHDHVNLHNHHGISVFFYSNTTSTGTVVRTTQDFKSSLEKSVFEPLEDIQFKVGGDPKHAIRLTCGKAYKLFRDSYLWVKEPDTEQKEAQEGFTPHCIQALRQALNGKS